METYTLGYLQKNPHILEKLRASGETVEINIPGLSPHTGVIRYDRRLLKSYILVEGVVEYDLRVSR